MAFRGPSWGVRNCAQRVVLAMKGRFVRAARSTGGGASDTHVRNRKVGTLRNGGAPYHFHFGRQELEVPLTV